MKKLIFLIITVAVAVTVNAQQYSTVFANDTVQGDTTYYPSSSTDPNTLRPNYGIKSTISTGVISFTFTHTDVADSLKYVRFEGSDDATNWTALTGNASLANTTTNGTSTIYTSTPLTWLYYRVFLACATGDTVAITNPKLIYKEH